MSHEATAKHGTSAPITAKHGTSAPVRVTIFNEYLHELENETVASIYPDGIHQTLTAALEERLDVEVTSATLREPEHGLSQAVVDATDVMIWWGHKAHAEVADEIAERVKRAVLDGMGLIVLHSGHLSRPFLKLIGTHGSLKWREADEKERLWNLQPGHPLMKGIGDYFELPQEEMYGERFDVPEPDELLMISWFQGGEVFRSLMTWRRGNGRLIYFRPGHETYPTYYDENVRRIIANAVTYANPHLRRDASNSPNSAPLEEVPNAAKEHVLDAS